MRILCSLITLFILNTTHVRAQETVRNVNLNAGALTGILRDNIDNAKRQGSGFTPLAHDTYPGKVIYHPHHVGLNFEHVFNGTAADKAISMFTPRKDVCILSPQSPQSATITWPAKDSAWDLDCQMTYTLAAPNAIDLHFEVTPRAERFPLDYAAFMWASYMHRTRERRIHFLGTDGDKEGWISFGDDVGDSFETGTVFFAGVPDLPYEEGAQALNIIEHPTKKFVKPFYYGLIDGDQDLSTQDDTLVYIMMFDQTTPIRFAMWNFMKTPDGKADPHSPAWDWQFIIHNPTPNKTYTYNARVVIKPFVSREDVEQEYEVWSKGK